MIKIKVFSILLLISCVNASQVIVDVVSEDPAIIKGFSTQYSYLPDTYLTTDMEIDTTSKQPLTILILRSNYRKFLEQSKSHALKEDFIDFQIGDELYVLQLNPDHPSLKYKEEMLPHSQDIQIENISDESKTESRYRVTISHFS